MKIDHESLTGTFEQKRALVRQFNLMDDDFFAVVMQDKKAFQTALRILTQRDDLTVKEVRTQYNIRNLVAHSVTLDGYAEDKNGVLYNIEIQVTNKDYHEKRVRYYQSIIDTSMLEKGVSYSKLPDLYLIFICSFDIFKKNKSSYEIKRMLKGYEEEVPNGIHELYFNTKAKENNNISELLQYFENSNPEIDKFGDLSKRVKFFKETMEGVNNMCDAVKEYCEEREAIAEKKGIEKGISIGISKGREEGRAEGRAEGREEGISIGETKAKNILIEKMRKKGMSEEEIKTLLDE